MRHLRPLLAGAAVVAALVGAVVYGGVRATHASNTASQASGTASRASDHGPLPTTLVTSQPTGTRAPSTYGYGKPMARAEHGEVLAYTPHRLPYKLLQIPFTITNNGPEAAMYSVYFTVEIGDGADKASYRQVVTSGGLAAHHTMATRATIGNVDKLPAGAIRVTITDVQKRSHSDLPS
ncbi:hypothetical protein AQJ46_08970 [Streptomyces canus]|uniref:Uncharacterized protein n=1 Tax=Streptomyces canus TaxID=58343 RepID=A0A101SG58_9ACTN|nr:MULTISPECIES: hypothetical protein [Streptomyces]KUN73330.1 hypothetical protein AQJ46_08970 [Streptomyces canus]MDI5903476.1 hypothetical protein [Streptomyces sp. 12257]